MENCRICLEDISPRDQYITKCGHTFHKECFEHLENVNKKSILRCPICNEILRIPTLDNINELIDDYIHDWDITELKDLDCHNLLDEIKLTYGKKFNINPHEIHAMCEERKQIGGKTRRHRKHTKRHRKHTNRHRKHTKRYRK